MMQRFWISILAFSVSVHFREDYIPFVFLTYWYIKSLRYFMLEELFLSTSERGCIYQSKMQDIYAIQASIVIMPDSQISSAMSPSQGCIIPNGSPILSSRNTPSAKVHTSPSTSSNDLPASTTQISLPSGPRRSS